jgi:hypothetical protein
MAFFSLVDNFFLLSVVIVVALLVFLIYHFKSRIALAEQKTDTLFRLMTIVTQKVSSLFESPPPPVVGSVSDAPPAFAFPTTGAPPVQPVVLPPKAEVIVLGLSPLSVKERILVSDDEASDDDDENSDEDDDASLSASDSDSDSESYDIDESCKIDPEEVNEMEEIQDFTDLEEPQAPLEIMFSDIPLHAEEMHAEEITMEAEDFDTPDVGADAGAAAAATAPVVVVEAMDGAEDNEPLIPEGEAAKDPAVSNEAAAESVAPQPTASPYTADQLKKMNINQLKTMALQQGVCTDTTKIKKSELVQLLLANGL